MGLKVSAGIDVFIIGILVLGVLSGANMRRVMRLRVRGIVVRHFEVGTNGYQFKDGFF